MKKANGDRVFCHFIDGRGVLRRRLAGDRNATLSIRPPHVEWTGIYFGVNAGYGWAQGSSNTVFGGGAANTALLIPAAATTPLGLGATELGGTSLLGSSSPRGGTAGGQIGFNWQAGMVVFGAEFDAQWSGQSNA